MEILGSLVALLGCLGPIQWLLALAALVDVFRSGADWYWVPVILFFPGLGPIAYFVIVRGPWSGTQLASMSPVAARRKQARSRLRQLDVQLANWRGPILLAEAGEELLILGRIAEAEKALREARELGAPTEEVCYRYAQVLGVLGRWAEAVPLMEELYAVDPDARLGEARLHFARCLDEAGDKARAETILRELLERRRPVEARVRLARLLLGKGETAEARELLDEVAVDGRHMPAYLRRLHRPWLWAAKRLGSATQALPRYRGPLPGQRLQRLAVLAGAAFLGLLLLAYLAVRLAS